MPNLKEGSTQHYLGCSRCRRVVKRSHITNVMAFWPAPRRPANLGGATGSQQAAPLTRWVNHTGRKTAALLTSIEQRHGCRLLWSGLSNAAPVQCERCSWGFIPINPRDLPRRLEVPLCPQGHDAARRERRALEQWVRRQTGHRKATERGRHQYQMSPLPASGLQMGAYCINCPAVILTRPSGSRRAFPYRAEFPVTGGKIPEPWSKAHRDYLRGGLYDPQLREEVMSCSRPNEPEALGHSRESVGLPAQSTITWAAPHSLPAASLPNLLDNNRYRSELCPPTQNILPQISYSSCQSFLLPQMGV